MPSIPPSNVSIHASIHSITYTSHKTEYGFAILNALVTDLEPDGRVKAAMNEINASKRMKEAARERAEGDKTVVIRQAEAQAESKYLTGVGVSKQRKAIGKCS